MLDPSLLQIDDADRAALGGGFHSGQVRRAGLDYWPMVDLLYALGAAAVFLVSAAFIIKGTYNPFIYFNF